MFKASVEREKLQNDNDVSYYTYVHLWNLVGINWIKLGSLAVIVFFPLCARDKLLHMVVIIIASIQCLTYGSVVQHFGNNFVLTYVYLDVYLDSNHRCFKG